MCICNFVIFTESQSIQAIYSTVYVQLYAVLLEIDSKPITIFIYSTHIDKPYNILHIKHKSIVFCNKPILKQQLNYKL